MSPVYKLASFGNTRLAASLIAATVACAATFGCGAAALAADNQKQFTSEKEFAKTDGQFVKEFKGNRREFIKEFGFASDEDTASPEEILAEKKRQAEDAFKRKLETANMPETFELAVKYHQVGDLEKAIPFYRLVLKQDPKFNPAYNNLGLCLIDRKGTGDLDEAKELLSQSQKLDVPEVSSNPEDETSKVASAAATAVKEEDKFLALALASEESGDLAKAAEYYQKVLDKQQSIIVIDHLSKLLTKMGNFNGARAVLKRGILSAPPEEHMKILYEALTNLDNKSKPNTVE